METRIQARWDRLEEGRGAIVARVLALSPEDRLKPGQKGTFSPVNVLHHFALAEEYHLDFLRKAPPESLENVKVFHGPFYAGTVKGLSTSERPIGTLPFMVPKAQLSLEESRAKWDRVRAELEKFVGQAKSFDRAFIKMMFLFGTLSLDDYFRLLEAHQRYHLFRIPTPE